MCKNCEDNRHIVQQNGDVVILAPKTGATRSYHQGKSSRELWKESRDALIQNFGRKRRVRKTVLFA